ncbi:hypothetical protein HZS_2875 [Henneguya salminicola]|nr:hypothetical protein HZS_2875 [Henneguya salminicola]
MFRQYWLIYDTSSSDRHGILEKIDPTMNLNSEARIYFEITIYAGVDGYSMCREVETLKMLHVFLNSKFMFGGESNALHPDEARLGSQKISERS